MSDPITAGERLSVLVVCHANLCRSPMAERLLRHALVDRMGLAGSGTQVSSAGTHARAGLSMHPYAVAVLREHGTGASAFRSRPVTADLVGAADLVLTATRRQRSDCVLLAPARVRHTFTLLQFERLAARVTPIGPSSFRSPRARLGAVVDQLPLIRGELPVAAAGSEDLADPVNGSIDAFRRCAADIQRAVNVVVSLVSPTGSRSPT